MNISKTNKKIYGVVFGALLLIGICSASMVNGMQKAVGFDFMQYGYFYTDTDARIPTNKQLKVVICTYDNPERLMDYSYVEIRTMDDQLLKSQYFNGEQR